MRAFDPSGLNLMTLIPTVVFYDSKCTFRLNRTIHPKKCAMNAFWGIHNFSVPGSQFLLQSNGSILVHLFALRSIRTACTIFTLIDLFLMSVSIPFDMLTTLKMKCLSGWAAQDAIFVNFEIYCSEWIILIFGSRYFFLEHRESHVFFIPCCSP